MASRHYRAHQRFIVEIPVTVTSIHRTVAAHGKTLDVGIGGAACELDTPLRMGEHVQVLVTGTAPRILKGEVAWVGWAESSSVRVGVRFDPSVLEQLVELLEIVGAKTADVGS